VADAFPDAQIDVVEIDPAVIEVGRKFFRLDEYLQINAVADDARRFLRLSANRYDLIFGDAYHGARCVPSHLVTREFFELVKGRLNEGGVYVMNVAAAPKGDGAVLFRCVAKTLSEVFEHQSVFCTFPDEPERVQNVFIVAASHDLELDAVRSRPGEVGRLAADLFTGYLAPDRYDLSDGVVFTDDRNPVEFLVARSLRVE
jgi:spermidine synthase